MCSANTKWVPLASARASFARATSIAKLAAVRKLAALAGFIPLSLGIYLASSVPRPADAAPSRHGSSRSGPVAGSRATAAAPVLPLGGANADATTDSLAPEEMIGRALRQTVLLEGDGVYGSGILIVPARGLILTNWHVVEDMRAPRVTLSDGSVGSAHLVESDRGLDLALLEGPVVDAPPPALGDATDLRPAQTLYAIGSPRKLGFTVSRGIVSYAGRSMDGTRYIQTDLAINDGNSGGPVLDTHGRIVGIMTFILRRSSGLAFALPINYAVERFAGRLPEAPGRAAYLDRFRGWKGH